MSEVERAYLLLADGTVMRGKSFGAKRTVSGEVVFNTSMTGYQEIISDPSYYGQIVTMTYPLIGNYGVNRDDFECISPSAFGLIVREHCSLPSNWRSDKSINELLTELDIPGLTDIDTRKLTRLIRKNGTMRGMIITESELNNEPLETYLRPLQNEAWPHNQVAAVSTKSPFHCPGSRLRVVLMDFGSKTGILRELTKRKCDVRVVPYDTSVDEIKRLDPDGIMLSNGPGDPQNVPQAVQTLRELVGHYPMFGICLGHQLFALACGADTERLKFGHRGANHPVRDLENDRTMMTSQNHSYTVSAQSLSVTELKATHVNVNDQTIEGIRHTRYPAFSVQFHPEALPGPVDSNDLFDRFMELMITEQQKGETAYATTK